MQHWQSIISHIGQTTGQVFALQQQRSVAGGSINAAFVLSGEKGQKYFVKTNASGQQAMFEAEARGLKAMASSQTLTVPQPICVGDDQSHSYIVLQYLDMKGQADQRMLGQQLAAMHRVTAPRFGWEINNTIGATLQPNNWTDDWLVFWASQRLGFQLRLTADNGYTGELQILGEKLQRVMPSLFSGRQIKASMLHGDLWAGNVAGLQDGSPVIFDPAFYYGDREADLAMTYLFGGFSPDFYASYENAYPLDDGFAVRKVFYNIYHVLNHLNMFGGAYHGQVISMMKQVLAQCS